MLRWRLNVVRTQQAASPCTLWVLMLSGVGGTRRCKSYVGSHQEIVNRDDSDGVNAQLRDIAAFASRIARSLPATAVNNKPTDVRLPTHTSMQHVADILLPP